MKSRKRGGDPDTTGRRRGQTKKKKNVKVIKLVSSAETEIFYAKMRNTKSKVKLEIKKYDPNIRCLVAFTEVK